MPGDDIGLGNIQHKDGYFEAHLERYLNHDAETVWSMLTVPDRFVDWLAPGRMELRLGGAAKLNFVDSGIVIDSEVTACEPLRTLEYSWSGPDEPERPVRWTLTPHGNGIKLSLMLRIPDDEDAAKSCAGWEAHLMMLLAAIEGIPIKFPFERFQESRELYNALV